MTKINPFHLFFLFFIVQNVFAQNTPPTLINDVNITPINTPLTVVAPGILANDSDVDGDALFITQFTINGTIYLVGDTAILTEGTITINANGSYVFIPSPTYVGIFPTIIYEVSDGTDLSTATLILTISEPNDLINISNHSTCNQGYTLDGDYNVQYTIRITNNSNAVNYNPTSLISTINLTDNLQNTFGNGCATLIDQMSIQTSYSLDVLGNPYPQDWDINSLNPNFENLTSSTFFNPNAIATNILYPRQSINISFCVTVDPFCNGRPNPTPSGSGIDFDNTLNVTSSNGNQTNNLLISDFHTTETSVAAGIYIPNSDPLVNFDGTYDFTNTIVITNEGTATANDVNYNMGLGNFLNNGVVFTSIIVTQTAGNPVAINTSYDGDTNTKILIPNQSLAAGETIVFEIYYVVGVISSQNRNFFSQLSLSMTQGALDGFNEDTLNQRRTFSFVTWSDALGDHLDRYYTLASAASVPTSNEQCNCTSEFMRFLFDSTLTTLKTITDTESEPNGILEHEEVTFQLTITNTSTAVQIGDLQIQDDLNNICSGNILSVSNLNIVSSTAVSNPILNPSYNGTTDINLLNGTSGILEPNQNVVIEFTVIFNEDCIGINTATFTGSNPLNNTISSDGTVNVSTFTDSDNDGISNIDDIDDDNDTIPDTIEYGGLNPLDDDDNDLIPNYRDINFGVDSNNDGIVDLFDFDRDGIPNHFDLDSDNDGIFDITEAGNTALDVDDNGITDNPVGINGLDNTVENNDTFTAVINYTIPNTDTTGNNNYLDIDSDGDGIVDNIEGQSTDNYIAPNGTVDTNGIDTSYPNGINPVDTEGDTIFDYIDTNSDNDVRDDYIEGWDFNNDGTPETIAANNDADNDGLDDAYDNNDSQINPTNSQIPTSFPNVDNTDTSERDWREIIAIIIRIDNVSIIEGGDLIFTISLTTMNDSTILVPSATPIIIDLFTSDGASTTTLYDVAITPFDYNQVLTTQIIIPPFQTTETLSVTTLDDIIYELDELLTLNGTILSNNTINTEAEGIGTILDNEVPPTITMNDTIEDEGVDLVHTIVISHPSSTPVNISIKTSDIIAISPEDYSTYINTLIIDGTIDPANANTQATFSITTNIDNLNEPDQEPLAVIGQVTSNNVGLQDLDKTGTILDLNPDPTIIINNPTVVEGNTLVFTLSMIDGDTDLPMQNYAAINFDINSNNITAIAPNDYSSLTTTASIPPLTESISLNVSTIDDNLNEDTETMSLIATVTSANVANSSPIIEGIGTIKDNDIPNLFSPNNDGMSDTFAISGMQDFPEFILIIFDRWGSEVHNYSNKGNINPEWWDGTYKNKPVPEGVYFYTLDFNDAMTKPKTNFIELIR
ncbi:MAG: hypothetical protein COA67_05350 [Lutibacter sp.]|nr:MAG: hypothetical protein COA67_05350 [Lutibacter sp.]